LEEKEEELPFELFSTPCRAAFLSIRLVFVYLKVCGASPCRNVIIAVGKSDFCIKSQIPEGESA
jgi:hypothetical protein